MVCWLRQLKYGPWMSVLWYGVAVDLRLNAECGSVERGYYFWTSVIWPAHFVSVFCGIWLVKIEYLFLPLAWGSTDPFAQHAVINKEWVYERCNRSGWCGNDIFPLNIMMMRIEFSYGWRINLKDAWATADSPFFRWSCFDWYCCLCEGRPFGFIVSARIMGHDLFCKNTFEFCAERKVLLMCESFFVELDEFAWRDFSWKREKR